MENRFTLYWLDGSRNIVSGATIEEAFTAAGYGAGAIKALDWYDNGVSNSHFYSKEEKQWVKYMPMHIHSADFQAISKEDLVTYLNGHQEIIVDLPSKDQYAIRKGFGCFAGVGWSEFIDITFAEYCNGPYFDNDDSDHHYMVTNTEYFNPDNVEDAITAFIERFSNPFNVSGKGKPVEEVCRRI